MADHRTTLLGLGWGEILARTPTRTLGGGVEAVLAASDSHRTSAAWWPRGSVRALAVREGAEVWIQCLAGELVVERWARDDEGGWHGDHDRDGDRRARAGESLRLDAGSLHRIVARRTASVLVVSSPPEAIDEAIERPLLGMLCGAREAAPSESITSVGSVAPCDDGETDA